VAVFVVHEHHSSHLHFDLRLEMEGVLKSWAVPTGPSMNPQQKRLAVHVDDHPLEYGSFEGIIPEGLYGAGEVLIWDRGAFSLKAGGVREGRLEFTLKGRKLKGAFVLVRMSGKVKEWLLIKQKDEYADLGFTLKTVLTPSARKRLREKAPPCEAS
jgi:bifunctional non-homologous end joining protein LigD